MIAYNTTTIIPGIFTMIDWDYYTTGNTIIPYVRTTGHVQSKATGGPGTPPHFINGNRQNTLLYTIL